MKPREFVAEKMRAGGLTQTEMARKCGVAQSTINNILSGAELLMPSTLKKIAEAFGESPDIFLATTIKEELQPYHTKPEQRLLDAFRHLDPGRQTMAVEMLEGWAKLSVPHGIGGRDSGLQGQNCA